MQYSINHSKIVFENFDDEVVLINLDNGNYFSIRETAGVVWKLIENGYSVSDCLLLLEELYEVTSGVLESEVSSFLSELEQEGLIVNAFNLQKTEVKISDFELKSTEYVAPKLEVYSDMQDLILLDPIHEVDESGWPNVKDESKDSETL